MLNPFRRLGKRQQQPAKLLSQADYDTLVRALATQANQGASWEQILAVIQARGLTSEQVAQWMTTYGGQWVQQPEPEFGKGVLRLSEIAEGSLAVIAATLGQAIIQGPSAPPLSLETLATSKPADGSASPQNPEQSSVPEPDATVLAEIEPYLRGDFSFADLNQLQPTPTDASTNQPENINPRPTPQPHSPTASDWFGQGNTFANLGRYEEALASYDQAISLQPDYAIAWNDRGYPLANLGRYEEALASYDQAISLQPELAMAWFNRGSTLAHLGRYEKSLASYDQAISLQPDYAKAWNTRGLTLANLRRYEAALASHDQAISLQPDYATAWLSRGAMLHNHLSRYVEALFSNDQAITLQPDNAMAWFNRGNNLMALGRYEESLASYDQALTLQSDDATAWNNRGLTLANMGRYEEAMTSYDQALTLQPDYATAWNKRGLAVANLLRHNPDDGSLFTLKIQQELDNRSRQALSSFSSREASTLLKDFLQSLETSKRLLLQTFAQADNPQLLELIQQPPSPKLEQVISAPTSAELLFLVQQPIPATVVQKIAETAGLHPSRLRPELQVGGYQGKLNSYRAELGEQSQDEPKKAICKDTHPEGWGELHRAIGQAHYFEGRRQASPRTYWREAVSSFKRALETLQPPKFEHLYFETLQDLMRALLDLEEVQEAQTLGQDATDYIQRTLAESDRRQTEQQQLGLWLTKFQQLTVDAAIQAGDFRQALSTAETAKNVCLRWLLDLGDVPKVGFEPMQALLDDYTATLYWHLSPAALITFLLLPGASEPIVIVPPALRPGLEEGLANDERSLGLKQILHWEDWLSQWNRDYENYSSAQSKTDKNLTLPDWRRSHPWRTQMPSRLESLGQLLNVEAIHAALKDYPIQRLRLIPHRDLHRLPLHLFFEQYDCAYLPSAKVGLDRLPQIDRPALSNVLIAENPKSTATVKSLTQKLDELPFAEVESALIQQQFQKAYGDQGGRITLLENQQVPYDRLLSVLGQPHQVFHFTGHGLYNSRSPAQSCLFLTGGDRLTLANIVHPDPELGYHDLSAYQLVFLAACETGVSGNQTITDEYVGLVSAFLKAKAAYVVSTLWRIESGSSMIFVTHFYQSLLAGEPPAKALRASQTFVKSASYDQISAAFHSYIVLIQASDFAQDQKDSLQLILEDELSRLGSKHRAASTMESHQPSECPYHHPYYWAAYTVSGL